jgi:hypothetical protein
MSFSRDNQLYKSLPANSSTQSQRYINQVSLNMPTASTKSSGSDNSTLTNSSSSTTKTGSAVKPNAIVNSEEFAKLDALLEDLLAEVDQPIFLSKAPQHKANKFKSQVTANVNGNGKCVSEVERSVDWLTEQKELLRARKDTSNNIPPYRSIKSKLDYYLNSNLNDMVTGSPAAQNGNNRPEFSYDENNFSKANGFNQSQLNSSFNPIDESVLIDQGDDFKNNSSVVNMRAPSATPSVRPNDQQLASNHTHFRSLSTNPNLLVNIFSE